MNYWPADLAHVPGGFEPLAEWTRTIAKSGRKTAKSFYGSGGWVAHHTVNAWGATQPGPARGVHMMEAESGAFLCQNIWDHFAFTQDRKYLETVAWPILKGASEFWMENLWEVGGGKLAVNPSYSPEHGPLSDGAYYSTMVVWDLFSNTIGASETLGVDPEFREKLRALRDRLQAPATGRYGQLREWRDPAMNKGADKDRHRHVSHLYAVYPGHQIVAGRDEKLTAAAMKSLQFRGDEATGWSMGWKINLWARFLDGDHVHKLIGNFISRRLYPNLWDSCPPFQIDGNFGYTAGVAEMLIQSHVRRTDGPGYEIRLLPALPKAWPDGTVRGLRARGGLVFDISWKNGELTSVTIRPGGGTKGRIHYKNHSAEIDLDGRKVLKLNGELR
jgi:alpha-L-fucosidase 2